MKRTIAAILTILALGVLTLAAQDVETVTGPEIEQAGVEVQVDSALLGMDIFSALPDNVVLVQSPQLRSALLSKTASDASKLTNGFRIRIYSSSARGAREASLAVLRRFNSQYPRIQVYRSYAAPNFKVTVGNFRNRAEAESLCRRIKADYPDAFIVREKFRYPSIGRADTSQLEEDTIL